MTNQDTYISILKEVKRCSHCCIPVGYPGFHFIESGHQILCNECLEYLSKTKNQLNRELIAEETHNLINSIRNPSARYDAIFAYSGGKDSTAALYSAILEYKLRLLVFNFDNGFKGSAVEKNIHNVIKDLNLDFYQIKSQTSYTIIEDIQNNIFPCGRCSALKFLYPELSKTFDIKYIITGIECVFNNEVIRDRGTFYQINWPAAFNWSKEEINRRVSETPWEDPGYGVFDSDCLCPSIALEKIYSNSDNANMDMYYGKKEQHIVPYYSRLVRFGTITQEDFYRIIGSNLETSEKVKSEFQNIIRIDNGKFSKYNH